MGYWGFNPYPWSHNPTYSWEGPTLYDYVFVETWFHPLEDLPFPSLLLAVGVLTSHCFPSISSKKTIVPSLAFVFS